MAIIFITLLVIAIPIYSGIFWILRKYKIGKVTFRNPVAIVSAMILSPLVLYGVFVTYFMYADYHPNYEFDKDEWMSNTEERYEMSQDIIESEMLIGMSKNQVESLLGEYEFTYNENHWAYGIGFVPGIFNIDPSVLDIYFEDNKVIKVTQHET